MDEATEFILDFQIPQGPTGPTGPNPPMCYVDYNTSNNTNRLSIKNTNIFHSNGEFATNNNELVVNSGTYEITFCGKIEVSGDFKNNIMVSLQESLGGGYSQPIDGMTITLPSGTACMHFSETRILNFTNTTDIVVIITNQNASPVTVSMGTLILRKIL